MADAPDQMKDIGWYRARLAAMSPGEVAHRVRAAFRKEWRQLAVRRRRLPPPLLAAARRRAETGAERPIRFFDVQIDFPRQWPCWSQDYRSGARAPERFYGKVDYRLESAVGDSKYTWELNRHQFVVPWALEWQRTRDESAAAAIVAVILDWIAANPRYVGINWGSALELGLRILSWGLAFDVAAEASFVHQARPLVQGSVAEQAAYIRHTLSEHSSANNHLLGELVGLLAAGAFFPEAEATRAHAAYAASRFVDEMRRQNFGDGVNREQAVYYHHYVLEYLLVGTRLLERLGQAVPADLRTLAHRMLSFVDAMTDDDGRPFAIGDADDGAVSGLNQGTGIGVFESLLWAGWVVFDDPALGAHAARIAARRDAEVGPDPSTLYWHGARAPLPAPSAALEGRWLFPDGGYLIERSSVASLAFRAGPFGYPSIAAHAHCDQLSVALRTAEWTVLADSGTGVYHTEERWRRYFRGTSAHNTVRVDRLDQAEYAGPFLWRTHANATLVLESEHEGGFRAIGRHDGYRRLLDPVDHTRQLSWDRGRGLRVEDRLTGRARHLFELFWNLGPGVRLEDRELGGEAEQEPWGRAWTLRAGDRALGTITVTCSRPAAAEVRFGDEATPAGFEAPRYRVLRPIEQLRVWTEGDDCSLTTWVRLGDPGDATGHEEE